MIVSTDGKCSEIGTSNLYIKKSTISSDLFYFPVNFQIDVLLFDLTATRTLNSTNITNNPSNFFLENILYKKINSPKTYLVSQQEMRACTAELNSRSFLKFLTSLLYAKKKLQLDDDSTPFIF